MDARQVGERITADQDEIGMLADGDGAEFGVFRSGEESRGVDGGGAEDLDGWETGAAHQIDFAVKAGTGEEAGLEIAAGDERDPGGVEACGVGGPGVANRAEVLEPCGKGGRESAVGEGIVQLGEDFVRLGFLFEPVGLEGFDAEARGVVEDDGGGGHRDAEGGDGRQIGGRDFFHIDTMDEGVDAGLTGDQGVAGGADVGDNAQAAFMGCVDDGLEDGVVDEHGIAGECVDHNLDEVGAGAFVLHHGLAGLGFVADLEGDFGRDDKVEEPFGEPGKDEGSGHDEGMSAGGGDRPAAGIDAGAEPAALIDILAEPEEEVVGGSGIEDGGDAAIEEGFEVANGLGGL